jgi:cytochrome c oxidase subunit 4
MNQHVLPIRANLFNFGALLMLLAATVWAAYLPLGVLHFPIAMAISTLKTVLIALFFMHLIASRRTTIVVAFASLLWLAIMIGLTLCDYHSRGWLDIPGK